MSTWACHLRRAFVLLWAFVSSALATVAEAQEARPIDGITDNSFLIEEACHKEWGKDKAGYEAGVAAFQAKFGK